MRIGGTSLTSSRLESLDALRGFDMLFISGLSTLVIALCAMVGTPECWLAEQMRHVAWTGLHHHDTIFPLFLFLAGASWPFSLAAQRAKGVSDIRIVWRLARRAIAFSLFAAVLGGLLTFDWANIRYLDVLTTIGCCGGISAILYMYLPDVRKRILICAFVLVGYWTLLRFVSAPDAAAVTLPTSPEWQGRGPFSLVGNLCGYVDRQLLPGLYYTYVSPTGAGIFEEDGILHNIDAIATAMLGVFAGEIVRRDCLSGNRKTVTLLVSAVVCLLLTLAGAPFCPIIMKIWSPTYVLANAAYSFAIFALFYWIIDVKHLRGWAFLLRVIGMNSITIYLMNRTGISSAAAQYCFGGLASLCDLPGYHSAVLAVGLLIVNVVIMYVLHRKGIFLKV